MSSTHPPLVRTRLSSMMFLEFFVWGGWYVAIGGYANKLQFTGSDIGWLISTTALGAIIAPLFVGYVADRYFATERMLSVMHLFGGVCLLLAAQQKAFGPMLALLMLNGLFFMPTLALANSLAFRHIPDPAKFPRIALLGTIGWIVSNLIVTALGGAETNTFFYVSGIGAIVMSIYCLTLPHTPPSGVRTGGGAVFGLDALKLLRDPAFLVFTICAFLIVIPACVFFVATVPMLQEKGYPAPVALMTLNQISEMFFMFTMPLFVVRLGLKRVLAIGMAAWGIRYFCFASGDFPLVILGLILHGFCYSFVFVGAYMYVDRRAPADLKASAQSLVAFLMLGVGWFLGCKAGGMLMDQFPAPVKGMVAVEANSQQEVANAPLPPWNDPNAAKSAWRYLDLSLTISELRTGKPQEAKPDLGSLLDKSGKGTITQAELDAIPAEGLTIDGYTYSRNSLIGIFKEIAKRLDVKETDNAVQLTRQQYLQAQSHDWRALWIYPAGMALAVCVFFLLAFHDKQLSQTPKTET